MQHRGRMSCSSAAAVIASESIHRGQLTRFLARPRWQKDDFNEPLRAAMRQMEATRGRFVFIVDATLFSQAGKKTENTSSTGLWAKFVRIRHCPRIYIRPLRKQRTDERGRSWLPVSGSCPRGVFDDRVYPVVQTGREDRSGCGLANVDSISLRSIEFTASKTAVWTMAIARAAVGGAILSIRMASSSTSFHCRTISAAGSWRVSSDSNWAAMGRNGPRAGIEATSHAAMLPRRGNGPDQGCLQIEKTFNVAAFRSPKNSGSSSRIAVCKVILQR